MSCRHRATASIVFSFAKYASRDIPATCRAMRSQFSTMIKEFARRQGSGPSRLRRQRRGGGVFCRRGRGHDPIEQAKGTHSSMSFGVNRYALAARSKFNRIIGPLTFWLYKRFILPWKRTPVYWSAIIFNGSGEFAVLAKPDGQHLPSGEIGPRTVIANECIAAVGLDRANFSPGQ